MLRIVLPITLSLAADVAVEIVVLIEIIVVVDVDVAAVPIAIAPMTAPSAPRGGTQRNSRSPHQSGSWNIARISVGIVGILNRSRSVHHSRVIGRDINYVGVRLLDRYDLLAARDCFALHYRLGAGF